ncbi:MAG: hypothetical protein L0G99_06170 [Propionibacteriales bacterium]|nr:hypothetical protein [Propionibacteriales bacterium]
MTRYAMAETALSDLTRQTSGATDDLGSLVRQLFAAAEPIEADFQGAGRSAFNMFKQNTDGIARGLNGALASVLEGIAGQDTAFYQGVTQQADETRGLMANANFDAARFAGPRG